jgi:uncharacterized protein (DUF433 family)
MLLATLGTNYAEPDLVRRLVDRLAEQGLIIGDSIHESSGVMGGAPCVRNTRIPVWLLVSFKKQGMTDGELLRAYPALDTADLAAAWNFYASHPEAIEAQIREQDEEDLSPG